MTFKIIPDVITGVPCKYKILCLNITTNISVIAAEVNVL